jgi:hypothetical protein
MVQKNLPQITAEPGKQEIFISTGTAIIGARGDELKSREILKAAVRLPVNKPMPAALNRKGVESPAFENEQNRTSEMIYMPTVQTKELQ